MKKILLFGEFSGLHTNLKEGLEELGHEVTIVSAGDGKKNIARDIDISVKNDSIFSFINSFFDSRKKIKKLRDFDVVQFINPYIKPKSTLLNYPLLFKNNKKFICLAAGDDVVFSDFIRAEGMSKYSPFDDELVNGEKLPYEERYHRFFQNLILSKFNLIIPSAYEYAEAYRQSKWKSKISNTIPYPINTTKIEYEKIKIDGKIVIYHASNRPISKGSTYINEALNVIGQRYPNDVEVISADFLPLEEYLDAIKRTHVLIDQCRSYSYAMNALYSLAQGKIVLSGCEDECIQEWGLDDSPVINIEPNVDDIVNKLEELILNKDKIEELSLESRRYVEEKHNHIMIAKEFIKKWDGI
ncbi:glycosyltransferase [Lysinibacillus sphaericus]|uniref:glycosyltransferase n=1 Tax=Lysinibacillus sphaericus TaxID=1421 RepID=UPI003CFF8522